MNSLSLTENIVIRQGEMADFNLSKFFRLMQLPNTRRYEVLLSFHRFFCVSNSIYSYVPVSIPLPNSTTPIWRQARVSVRDRKWYHSYSTFEISACSQTVGDRQKSQKSTFGQTFSRSECMRWTIVGLTGFAKPPNEWTQLEHSMSDRSAALCIVTKQCKIGLWCAYKSNRNVGSTFRLLPFSIP